MRRLHCGPAQWHIFARGTRRLELFRDDLDFQRFIQCLIFSLRVSSCELWAYALMSNHYHLVLYGDSDQLSSCLYQANRLYARYHNKKYRLNGHVFDGPYQAYRIPTPRLALWTVAYVFLNPVKAGLCSRPQDYRWSGYRSFIGLQGSPLPVASGPLMSNLELQPKDAWKRFHDGLRRQLRRTSEPTPGRPSMADVHRSQFQWLLGHAGQAARELNTEDQEALAVHWARQCGIAPRVLALELPALESQEISRRLYRLRKRMIDEPQLARLASIP